ncbi:dipeptidase [Biformimicrobium ophioploci]|uniref:Dipeptidase n=1 Tax=Biformimicrobium ophioploci TaxID=3036711 RepID=A0ABQ6LVC4_9GAMM|nr:dipeptidase [Microbulbifer sp. NKW57]GMG86002.1 dipeptidase [Microbulbifer sp. NKW57]
MHKKFLILALSSAIAACGQPEQSNTPAPAAAAPQQAVTGQVLAQRYTLIDTHVDVPNRMEDRFEDVGLRTEHGEFDFPRARQGGLDVPFMSIYIPPADEDAGIATEHANRLIDDVEKLVARHPDKFAIPYSLADMQAQVDRGLISLPMGMENGAPIAGSIDNLHHFAERGIRYITLCHSKSNHISDSSYDEHRRWNGLSEFGKKLVREMNKTGVMVDVSHISDDAFWQVMEVSEVPVIASHSSARHFTPGFERNMSDEMIEALAENGGLIMINFGSFFISQASKDSWESVKAEVAGQVKAGGLDPRGEEARALEKALIREKFEYADISDVLDHFDHVRDLVGVDHIGIGSDYDGVGDSLPTGLKDTASYPNLIDGLLERGYSEADIEKIMGGNLLRVWQQAEAYAAR